jgi:hypothetical protein
MRWLLESAAKNTSLAAVLLSCFGVIAKVLYDHVHGLT